MPVEFEPYDPDDGGPRLELSEDSNAYKILSFLAGHPETGFTPREVSEETDVPRNSVGVTLSRLEERDLVRHKEPYWAIGDDDRLASYAGMLHGTRAAAERFGDEDWGDWQETAVDPRNPDDGE